jgi:hypothetical protein
VFGLLQDRRGLSIVYLIKAAKLRVGVWRVPEIQSIA